MFDTNKFTKQKFAARTEDVDVPELKGWFDVDEKPVFKIKGLSHRELAIAEENGTRKSGDIIIKALAGTSQEKEKAIRQIAGYEDGTPSDTAKRIEHLIAGCVEPKMELQTAVKIAAHFPIVLIQVTNKILQLTGLGSNAVEKPEPSGKETM